MIDPAYVRALARYNRWQNQSLYAAADGLTDQARKLDRGAFFGSIQADQYSRLTPHIRHTVEPCIELGRPADRIGHRVTCSLLATPFRYQ